MLKLQTIGIAAMQALWLIAPPSLAQENQVELDSQCLSIVQKAQSRLQEGRNLSVQIRTVDQSEYQEDSPENRPILVRLVMDGTAAASVMNSSQLMKSISTEVIQHCESVSVVVFGVNCSGWHTTFGLFDQGRVKEFQCFEYVRGKKMPYGYQNCDV
jgi:hypothetical protein